MSLLIESSVEELNATEAAAGIATSREATVPPIDDSILIDGQRFRPHPNGGGLVAVTAVVGSEVYVAPTAQIRDNAIVTGHVQLLGRSVVQGNATISDRCSLSGDSVVEGFAALAGMVTLRRHARVGGSARLEGGITLDCHTRITRGHLFGPLFIG